MQSNAIRLVVGGVFGTQEISPLSYRNVTLVYLPFRSNTVILVKGRCLGNIASHTKANRLHSDTITLVGVRGRSRTNTLYVLPRSRYYSVALWSSFPSTKFRKASEPLNTVTPVVAVTVAENCSGVQFTCKV